MQTYILFQYYNPYWYIYCLCQRLRLSAPVVVVVLLCLCEMKGGPHGGASGERGERGWSEVGERKYSVTASHCTIQRTDH